MHFPSKNVHVFLLLVVLVGVKGIELAIPGLAVLKVFKYH